ncbi:hypothetical protein BH23BAC3_BH23BAC3_22370 [soil metagenome]
MISVHVSIALFFSALITGIGGLIVLKKKPALFSGSLADFNSVTVGKSILFVLILTTLFMGISTVESYKAEQVKWSALFYILLLAAWIDMERRIIPNGLILVGITIWLMLLITSEFQLAGLAAGFLLIVTFLIINLLSTQVFGKKGIGMGDVKLCLIIVLMSGLEGLWFIGVSVFLGGIFAGIAIILQLIDRKSYLPFAPFLLVGSAIGYFFISWQELSGLLYGF